LLCYRGYMPIRGNVERLLRYRECTFFLANLFTSLPQPLDNQSVAPANFKFQIANQQTCETSLLLNFIPH